MVFLLGMYGQRSNNLFQHVHIDSYCRDNGVHFYNKFIYQLKNDYPYIGKPNILIDFLLRLKIPQILRKFKLISYIDFNDVTKNDYYKSFVQEHALVSCEGWFLWSNSTVRKYRKHYQKLFDPAVDKSILREAFLQKETPLIKIVGVHVRRGDYINHEEGKYFFGDAVYLDKMQQLAKLLGGACAFLVFTNDETIDKPAYQAAFTEVLFSNRTAVEDHYLMSQCDYLIGPPSTFNMWASYMGDVPLYHIYEADATIKLGNFEVLHAQSDQMATEPLPS